MLRTSGPIASIKCLIQEITGENLGTEPVNHNDMVMGTYTASGEMLHEMGTAVVKDLAIPGVWDVTINKSMHC
jgi:hypothetical protein